MSTEFITSSGLIVHHLFMRFLAALIACIGFASVAQADAMRCGSRLVTFGDTKSAVRSICGDPSDIETRTILRRPVYDLHGHTVYYGDGYVEIPIEIWVYNFGPYKLMRQVRFVDGRVDEIETIGYGYHKKND